MLQESQLPSNKLDEKETETTSFIIQEKLQMIGSITYLMMSSDLHKRYEIIDISERFIPSLIHDQFRYCEIDCQPLGFVNWAWLSDEVEEKFQTGNYALKLDEWQSGNNLWFPEFIAPFGHARLMIKDLRANVLPKGTPAKSLRIRPDGSLKAIAHWRV